MPVSTTDKMKKLFKGIWCLSVPTVKHTNYPQSINVFIQNILVC